MCRREQEKLERKKVLEELAEKKAEVERGGGGAAITKLYRKKKKTWQRICGEFPFDHMLSNVIYVKTQNPSFLSLVFFSHLRARFEP